MTISDRCFLYKLLSQDPRRSLIANTFRKIRAQKSLTKKDKIKIQNLSKVYKRIQIKIRNTLVRHIAIFVYCGRYTPLS